MSKQRSLRQWVRAMRSREIVIAWLRKIGRTAPGKKLAHVEFAVKLQSILEPNRIEPRFDRTRSGAAAYVHEIATIVGARDDLPPPRVIPVELQRMAHERQIERRQRVFEQRCNSQRQRVEAKIASMNERQAERMAERRDERNGQTAQNEIWNRSSRGQKSQ